MKKMERRKGVKRIIPLRKWLGDGVDGGRPTRDRIQEALGYFYRTLRFDNPATARLVCFGCTEPFGIREDRLRKDRLIEDRERFPKLLDCTDQYRRAPLVFRRCYRGLLSGYFSYDPEHESSHPVGRQNWATLRDYLRDRLRNVETPGVALDWVDAIRDHKNLLTDRPCERYGLSALRGNDQLFQDLSTRLDIADASWLINKWFLAQIQAAVGQADGNFKELIDPVLHLLDDHPLLLNRGLARVLTRYRECKATDAHPALRDFAVAQWGNPWLALNNAKWGSVDTSTQKMVAAWLKLELIHQFFSVLAEDGNNDTRRLKFWQRYHERIDDMYFALGNTALRNRSADFQTLRKKMSGRLLRLHRGGAPTNNAFVMMMGNHVVVEFGQKGNACFIFRRENLPFPLDGYVAGDRSELKHDSHIERLLHHDRSIEIWESRFEQIIHGFLKYLPPKVRITSASSATRTQHTPDPKPARDGNAISKAAKTINTERERSTDREVSQRAFEKFVSEKRLRFADHRRKGGALWVMTDDSDPVVTAQLKAWGFRWAAHKRGWWKDR